MMAVTEAPDAVRVYGFTLMQVEDGAWWLSVGTGAWVRRIPLSRLARWLGLVR